MFDLKENIKQILAKYNDQPFNTQTGYVVEYLGTLDFNNPEIRKQAMDYVSQVLNQEMAANLPVSKADVKTIHCLVTHLIMADLGVQNTKLNYAAYWPRKNIAYYLDSNNSITFHDDEVCSDLMCNSYNGKYLGYFRTHSFASKVMTIAHEVKHADQYRTLRNVASGNASITPNVYHMSIQTCARTIVTDYGNLYSSENFDGVKYADIYEYRRRLYDDNHDSFLKEIDSDVYGINKAYELMKVISPKTYELMMSGNSGFMDSKVKVEHDMANLDEVVWKHDTNANGGDVQADQKAMFILTKSLPLLDSQTRLKCFAEYPALRFAFNEDGSKKPLKQVELERDSRIEKLMQNPNAQTSAKARDLSSLYETAISCDAGYLFERSMRDIVELNGDDEAFKTNGRFDPAKFSKRLNQMSIKAREIVTYMESLGYKGMHEVFEQYRKQAFEQSKSLDGGKYYRYKQDAFRIVDVYFVGNKNYRKEMSQIRTEKAMFDKETAKQVDILKTAFFGFNPSKQRGEFNKDGQLTMVDNGLEKLLVYKSYIQYSQDYRKLVAAGVDVSEIIHPSKVYVAFNGFYEDVIYTPQDEKMLGELMRSGEIGLLASCCTMELDAMQSDVKQVEQESAHTENIEEKPETDNQEDESNL